PLHFPKDEHNFELLPPSVEISAPASLGKTHVPHFKWKVHDFSALLETKATSAFSAAFDCSGYKWFPSIPIPFPGTCK
uniref:MATH domain-containing protein n=1 Tax=Aegilops tauschii subsp. strangulata TaxID=200361 RepID=A0A453QXA2_AEGTS